MNHGSVTEQIRTAPPPVEPAATGTSVRRLLFFAAGLVLTVVALELFVRANSSLFEAASHRALTKVAMFGKHPQAEILFLGTSRTQDGVSPVLVTRGLKEIAPELGEVPGFNAAFTGSSLDSLVALVPRFGFRKGLRSVVIELSTPQIFNAPAPWTVPQTASATMEDHLADAAHRIHFIRHRSAFLSDNLGRLPALLVFARSMSGWETKGKDQIASWFGREEESAAGFDEEAWMPELFLPSAAPQGLDATNESIAIQLASVAEAFQNHGIKVAFAVTPLARDFEAPEKSSLKPLFSEVARRGKCEVWSFAPLVLPGPFFHDPSHLNKTGRAHFSRALATQTARILKTP